MKCSVILIKTMGVTTCFIEKDDSKWLSMLKDTIKDFLKDKYVPERECVLSFCEHATCLKKLQVLVNTFIDPSFPFSWIITSSTLPEPDLPPNSYFEPIISPLELQPLEPELSEHELKIKELQAQLEALQKLP